MRKVAPPRREPHTSTVGRLRTIISSLAALAALGTGSAATAEPWYVCGTGLCVPSPAYCPGNDKRSWASCQPPTPRAPHKTRKPRR
jgi:hypothetical protein